LIDLLPGYKEDVMTIAEKLRMEGLERGLERGRVEGREEGRVEGWEKGRLEGEAAMLARQLSRRFGPLPEWARERVRRADAVQLEAWADAVLEAGSLAEVLGDAPGGSGQSDWGRPVM
ncbi:MAG: DUF4351 domain-containing protein, partial [Azoarcus sp.]|nr:DUF4351 domain-containing protein [Azoarcus sp.]